MINWDKVSELRGEIGAEDFGEVVEIFLEEVDEEITKLRHNEDHATLEAQLHFLKGSALNLGFTNFSDLCQVGETAAGISQFDNIDITAILTCYDASLHQFLEGLQNMIAA